MAAIPVSVSLKVVNSSTKRQPFPFGSFGFRESRFILIHFLNVVLYNKGIDLPGATFIVFLSTHEVILLLIKKLNIKGTKEPILFIAVIYAIILVLRGIPCLSCQC